MKCYLLYSILITAVVILNSIVDMEKEQVQAFFLLGVVLGINCIIISFTCKKYPDIYLLNLKEPSVLSGYTQNAIQRQNNIFRHCLLKHEQIITF